MSFIPKLYISTLAPPDTTQANNSPTWPATEVTAYQKAKGRTGKA